MNVLYSWTDANGIQYRIVNQVPKTCLVETTSDELEAQYRFETSPGVFDWAEITSCPIVCDHILAQAKELQTLKDTNHSGLHVDLTQRGFVYSHFTDRYGMKCSLQKSSLATEDCVWLGIDDPQPVVMAIHAARLGVVTDQTNGWVEYPIPHEVLLHTRMHLTQAMAAELIKSLQVFVDTGELPEPAEQA